MFNLQSSSFCCKLKLFDLFECESKQLFFLLLQCRRMELFDFTSVNEMRNFPEDSRVPFHRSVFSQLCSELIY